MGVSYFKEPPLENPVMIASWPGIGNIGLLAVETLLGLAGGEAFAEIDPLEFFYPRKLIIRGGELKEMEFPASRFYFKRLKERDLVFFIGEEQPSEGGRAYAEGAKAYRMANLVVDAALKFGCQRIYTSGAAVAPIHHSIQPHVWIVPNSPHLLGEVRRFSNTLLMSDTEDREGQGSITGLNGLLLGVARSRNLDAFCLMGEIPIYLQGFPFPYPKASRAVLQVLATAIGMIVDMTSIDEMVRNAESEIERLFESFPPEIRGQIDKLKDIGTARLRQPGPITEEDKRKILEDIDKMFKQGTKGE